jgi:hypothetical protein
VSNQIPPDPYLELLAVHEAFRRLGVEAADIYVAPKVDGSVDVLAGQNGVRYRWVAVEPGSVEISLFAETWNRAVRWWNAAPPESDRVFRSSRVVHESARFMEGLVRQGFEVSFGLPEPKQVD